MFIVRLSFSTKQHVCNRYNGSFNLTFEHVKFRRQFGWSVYSILKIFNRDVVLIFIWHIIIHLAKSVKLIPSFFFGDIIFVIFIVLLLAFFANDIKINSLYSSSSPFLPHSFSNYCLIPSFVLMFSAKLYRLLRYNTFPVKIE